MGMGSVGDAIEGFICTSDIALYYAWMWRGSTQLYIYGAIYYIYSIRIGRGHGPSATVPMMCLASLDEDNAEGGQTRPGQGPHRTARGSCQSWHIYTVYFVVPQLSSLTPIPRRSQHSTCSPWQGTYCVSSNLFAVCVA